MDRRVWNANDAAWFGGLYARRAPESVAMYPEERGGCFHTHANAYQRLQLPAYVSQYGTAWHAAGGLWMRFRSTDTDVGFACGEDEVALRVLFVWRVWSGVGEWNLHCRSQTWPRVRGGNRTVMLHCAFLLLQYDLSSANLTRPTYRSTFRLTNLALPSTYLPAYFPASLSSLMEVGDRLGSDGACEADSSHAKAETTTVGALWLRSMCSASELTSCIRCDVRCSSSISGSGPGSICGVAS